jgi:hypothetical protein
MKLGCCRSRNTVYANTYDSGEKLTIKATGNFKDKVEKGFKMHLQVKYGLITLINQEADGCDTIGKADLECPLDKGEMSLTKDVDLPREIPPVRITIVIGVATIY